MSDTIESPASVDVGDLAQEEPREPSGTGPLIRLLVGLAVIVAVFLAFGLGDLLLVIVSIVVIVMLHELGHFATAKWAKMKVTEYFVGFGPRLWSVRKGETEYGVKAIPAGGYVRIIGMSSLEEIEPDDEPRAYRNQPFGKRIIVASAGSAVHFLLAFLLAFGVLAFVGRPNPSVVTIQSYSSLGSGVTSPAQLGGLKLGDQILSIDGHKVTSADALISNVRVSAGKPVSLVVKRDGVDKVVRITPIDGRTVIVDGQHLAKTSGPPEGYLGVSLGEGTKAISPISAIGQSAALVASATQQTVSAIVHKFSPSGLTSYAHEVIHPVAPPANATGPAALSSPANNRPESIVGAVRTATQGVQAGAVPFIEILIALNIFIGIFNMLPMLPLDGGHVAIASYEWIRTRRGQPRYRANVAKMMPVAYAFVAFLLLFVSTAVYLDLTHPVANPFK